MTANELKINGNTLEDFLQTSREVDEYDNLDCRICAADSIRQLVDFVRQQQAEIEELKLKLNTWLFLNPASTITDKEIKDSVINCIGESEYERTDDHWWRLLAYDLLRKAQE